MRNYRAEYGKRTHSCSHFETLRGLARHWAYLILPVILASCTSVDQDPQASLASSIKERAVLSDKAGNHQLSGKLYRMLINIEPDDFKNHVLYLRSLRKSKNRELLQYYLKEQDIYNQSGLESIDIIEITFTLISFDFLDEANRFLVFQKDNISSEAMYSWLRGGILEREGQVALAITFYKNCLNLDPENKPCQIDYDRLIRE